MSAYPVLFDIETDGFLDAMTVIHCINLYCPIQQRILRFNDAFPDADGSVEDGARLLMDSPEVAGQNIHGFDIPAIKKIFPWFRINGYAHDTLAYARVIWPDVTDRDFSLLRKGKLPDEFQKNGLIGKHSLEAWGYRLGEYKGEFKGPWDTFTQTMDEYCVQDVVVTKKLWDKIQSKGHPPQSLWIENETLRIVSRQSNYGVLFDVAAGEKLYQELAKRRVQLEEQCRSVFAPWYVPDGARTSLIYNNRHLEGRGLFVPKKDNKKSGYTQGVPFTKIKQVLFNPSSRDHIADRLQKLYQWQPVDFTDSGKPKIDDEILGALNYPRVKEIAEYLMIVKRIGMLAEGDNGWLKLVAKDGRIHGYVNTNGANTGRMTHNSPNCAQVPAARSPYGKECRSLFKVPKGKKLVGCDAEGLELRALGHHMARWDDGAYVRAVVFGKKSDESDAHSLTKKAVGLNSRDNAKTWFYAFIYGAQDPKLGEIVVDDFTDAQKAAFYAKYPAGESREDAIRALGKRSRAAIAKNLPALGSLIEAIKAKAKANGVVKGLDGRLLHVRGLHSVLNLRLQHDGAVLMKVGLILLDKELQETYGLVPGVNYEFVLNVHDEWQLEVDEAHAEIVGKAAAEAIRKAGEFFNYRCPLAGDYAIGDNWHDTH